MSTLILQTQATTPSLPAVGDIRFWFNSSGTLCSIDSDGNEKQFGESLTQEQVKDYLAAALTNSATIDLVYAEGDDEITANLNSTLKSAYDGAVSHVSDTNNPHATTASQVGLNNVDNTSDANKPVSTAQKTALDTKVPHAPRVLRVSPSFEVTASQFQTIAAAIAAVALPTETNPYLILVEPATYVEAELVVPEWTSICGRDITNTIIEPAGNHSVFKLGKKSSLNFLSIKDAPTGYAAIDATNCDDFAIVHKISIWDCDIGILIDNPSVISNFYGEYVDINGSYTHAVKCVSAVVDSFINLENFYTYLLEESSLQQIYLSGIKCVANILAGEIAGFEDLSTAIYMRSGASLKTSALTIKTCDVGLHVANIGDPCSVETNLTIEAATLAVNILQTTCTGAITGSFDATKVYVHPSSVVAMSFTGGGNYGKVVLQDIYQGDRNDRIFNMSESVRNSATFGLLSGGAVTAATGLDLNIAAGEGYLLTSDDYFKKVSWSATTLTMPSNVQRWVVVDEDGAVTLNVANDLGNYGITLSFCYSTTSFIHYLDTSASFALHPVNSLLQASEEGLGVVYKSGSIVTALTGRELSITAGVRWFGGKRYVSSEFSQLTFEEHYKNGSGGFVHGPFNKTAVRNDVYDDGSGTLAAVPTGKFAKHSMYIIGEGTQEKYLFVFSQQVYDTQLLAESGPLPLPPPEFPISCCTIASFITQEGNAAIVQVRDERPIIGTRQSSVSAATVHANLTGLGSDDHTQYFNQSRGDTRYLAAVGTPGTYGSATKIPQITTDTQGRVSNVTEVNLSAANFSVKTTANLSNSSNATLANISELAFPVTAGKTYRFMCCLVYQSAAAGTGLVLTMGTTDAVGTITARASMPTAGDGTDSTFVGQITSFGDVVTSTAVASTSINYLATIEGVFICTTSGTLTPQFRSEVDASQVTIKGGSNIEVKEF